MDKNPDKIQFHYNMSNHYRVIHADGAFGGITPTGLINMNIFSERRPLPDLNVYKITDDNKIGEEIMEMRVGKNGVIREVESGILIDLEKAESLAKWLNDKITELKNIVQNKGDEINGNSSNSSE